MKRLTARDVMSKLGIRSRETLRKLRLKQGFPQPIKDDGGAINYFLENEVDDYLQRLAAQRDAASAKAA